MVVDAHAEKDMRPPECRWRSPRTPTAGSSQNSHAPTVH
jgi:hypothetical protein